MDPCGQQAGWGSGGGFLRVGSVAVMEPPAFVAGLDDIAVMGQAVEHCGGHFGVAEHGRPFLEVEIGGDDDRGSLVDAQIEGGP